MYWTDKDMEAIMRQLHNIYKADTNVPGGDDNCNAKNIQIVYQGNADRGRGRRYEVTFDYFGEEVTKIATCYCYDEKLNVTWSVA